MLEEVEEETTKLMIFYLPLANSTNVSGSFDCVSLTRMIPACVISLIVWYRDPFGNEITRC